jgi:hypothetical protein
LATAIQVEEESSSSDDEEKLQQARSKSARSRLQATDTTTALSASTSAVPSASTLDNDQAMQSLELDRLIHWGEKGTRTLLNDMKAATIEHHNRRASKFAAWLEQKLRANGVTEVSTLEEITGAVHQQLQPWQGLETAAAENRKRLEFYPHIKPVRRDLKLRMGKAKHAAAAKGGRFVYDMPVEDHLQQRWSLRPHEFQRTKEYLQQQVHKQANAVVDDNWLVDDYYTALNGLSHPRLGKSDSFIGV